MHRDEQLLHLGRPELWFDSSRAGFDQVSVREEGGVRGRPRENRRQPSDAVLTVGAFDAIVRLGLVMRRQVPVHERLVVPVV